MAAPIPLRSDFDAPCLRAFARRSRDPDQTRRLLALAAIYEGASRSEAARIGCVTLQIVRDWVLRFNARGPHGLVTGRAPGSRPLLNEVQRQELQRIVDHGPIPSVHGVVRWRLVDLVQWVFDEFRITISKQTLSRELRAMGYRKLSARPRHHARSEAAVSAFKADTRMPRPRESTCSTSFANTGSMLIKPIANVALSSAAPIAFAKASLLRM